MNYWSMHVAKKKSINLDQFFTAAGGDDDLTFLIGATGEQAVQHATELGFPLLQLPTQAIVPDPHQLRHLPHPRELEQLASGGDQAAQAIVTGLRELGQSMRDHGQIQPVIVYEDSDPTGPAVTHRLLNGHRRWSAAILVGLATLSAVQVPRPNETTRLVHQFEENERREGFSDMERAWALIAMKEALQNEAGGEVPWEVLEDQLQLSTSRRQDLLRLLRFSPEGQALIMRYGWSEWTLRPLHMAISKGDVPVDDAVPLLRTLAGMSDITAPAVAALVETYRGAQHSTPPVPGSESAQPSVAMISSKDLILVSQRMAKLRKTIDDLREGIGSIDDTAVRERWRSDAEALRSSLDTLLRDLS